MNNESAGRHLCMDDVEVIHAWLESGYGGCWTLPLETDGEQLEGVAVKVPGSRLGLGTYAVVMAGKFVNGDHFRTKRQLFIRLVDREDQADAKPTMFNEEKAYWAGPAVLSGMLSRDGLNTYELAVLHGFEGTLETFLAQAGIELQDLMVTKAKLSREVQTQLDKGSEKAINPAGDYDDEAEYSVNEMVYDEVTNSSYVSKQSVNVGHAVTDTDWWMKVLDGNYVHTTIQAIMTAAQATLDEAKQDTIDATAAALAAKQDTEQATIAANAVAAQKVADAQIGYYVCETAAGTATKQTTSDVIGEDHFAVPSAGGAVKVSMKYANTSTDAVYLQFGTNTNTKRKLYYNGEAASNSNTWDDGEVISVYLDPAANNGAGGYMASNAQGGSNKKIDAYLYGDLKTLAVGKPYKEGERVATIDKQLFVVTKKIGEINQKDTVAIGDLNVNGGNTYKAKESIKPFAETSTSGATSESPVFAVGCPSKITLTVAREEGTYEEGTINVTFGSTTAEITVGAEDAAADIATSIVSGLSSVEGWNIISEEGVITAECTSAGNNSTVAFSIAANELGVTGTKAVVVTGTNNVAYYDGSVWTVATIADIVSNIYESVDIDWLSNFANGVVEQNTVTKELQYDIEEKELLLNELTWTNGYYYRSKAFKSTSDGRCTTIDVRDWDWVDYNGKTGTGTGTVPSAIITYADNNGAVGAALGVYNPAVLGQITRLSLEGVGWIRYSVDLYNLSYYPYLKLGRKSVFKDRFAELKDDFDNIDGNKLVKKHFNNWINGKYYNLRNVNIGSTMPAPTSDAKMRVQFIDVVPGQKIYSIHCVAPISTTSCWFFIDKNNKILDKDNIGAYDLNSFNEIMAPPNAVKLVVQTAPTNQNRSKVHFVMELPYIYTYDEEEKLQPIEDNIAEIKGNIEEQETLVDLRTAPIKCTKGSTVYTMDSSNVLITNEFTIYRDSERGILRMMRTLPMTTSTTDAIYLPLSLKNYTSYIIKFHCKYNSKTMGADHGNVGTLYRSTALYLANKVNCKTTKDGADFEIIFRQNSSLGTNSVYNIVAFGVVSASFSGSSGVQEPIEISNFSITEYSEPKEESIKDLSERISNIESRITKSSGTYYPRIPFSIKVDITLPTFANTNAVDGVPVEGTDYGYLCLPLNYNPKGKPSRLVIFCHGVGADINTYKNKSAQPDSYLEHWIRMGYAVMDMIGMPQELSGLTTHPNEQHYGAPVTLQCYKKGYEYVIEHFNIRTDGIIVIGASMGGMSSFEIVQSGIFPVICQIAYCPVVDLFKQFWCNTWNIGGTPGTLRANMARYFGFTGTAPTWTDNSRPSLEEIQYFRDNLDKTIGYYPMMNNLTSGSIERIFDVIPDISIPAQSAAEEASYSGLIAFQPCPLKIFHNLKDGTVPNRYSKYYIGMAKRSGAIAEYRTFDDWDIGHAVWEAGDNVNLVDVNGDTFTVRASQAEGYWFAKRYDV